MNIRKLELEGVVLIEPRRFSDSRGYFAETFRHDAYRALGITGFVQDNESLSVRAGTIRGLHYQSPPHAQGKLVRCSRGSVVDVAVDARVGSPTYGCHIRVELGEADGRQLWVPPGFLHGFCTREPDTVVQYKVTATYSPEADGNVAYGSPSLGIDWGLDGRPATVSDKDAEAPAFGDWTSPFRYTEA